MNEPVRALCRACGARPPATTRHCPACGSRRLLIHDEIDRLWLSHIDCDAFFAAVEKRDNPALEGLPVIIGGGRRGVVATACYVARQFGVRSAMPMFKARALCPEAVIIKPDIRKYAKVGRAVRERMLHLTPLVEPLSIDEAFLDLSGTDRLHRMTPAETLSKFQRDLEAELGISISVGLSHNKFLAKIASDLDKPRGFSIIGKAETRAFLAPRPVGSIFGIGEKTAERLAREGYRTIADLQRADPVQLARDHGEMGLRLARLAIGEDRRKVTPSRPRKSVSGEVTFDTDIADRGELEATLRAQSERVSARLKASHTAGRTITLKLKTQGFRTLTRAHTLDGATQLADRIFREGAALLAPLCDGTRYRLLGIGVSELCDARLADDRDLLDPDAGKRAAAENAVDRLREKFGVDAIGVGRLMGRKSRARPLATDETGTEDPGDEA
ncbi:MAG: DNA polymerase IV [Hyphomicrobiaceae bacterium]|nr:DNA polymerase IV [Hyphomicrobiaceae bacterium]